MTQQIQSTARKIQRFASISALMLAATAALPALAKDEWLLHTGGVSRHMEQTEARGRVWNEQHPGFGIERRVADDEGWSRRQTLGLMQDSRNFWGGYAGVATMRQWNFGKTAEVSLGAGAYVFYRSMSWSGKMGLVPGVLPTLSITLPSTRTGINVLYVPKIQAYGKSMPSVVYAQLTVPI